MGDVWATCGDPVWVTFRDPVWGPRVGAHVGADYHVPKYPGNRGRETAPRRRAIDSIVNILLRDRAISGTDRTDAPFRPSVLQRGRGNVLANLVDQCDGRSTSQAKNSITQQQ